MTTTNTRNGQIIFVGASRGARTQLRQGIARRYSHPASRIEFIECSDSEAETVIAAKSLRGRYAAVVTAYDLRVDEALSEAVFG